MVELSGSEVNGVIRALAPPLKLEIWEIFAPSSIACLKISENAEKDDFDHQTICLYQFYIQL